MAYLINIEFRLDGADPTHISVATDDGQASQSFDPNIIAPDAAESNTSFNYSGRHDHGPLPQLNRDGPYSVLLCALQDAKQQTDLYLNSINPSIIAKIISEDNDNDLCETFDDNKGIGGSAMKRPKLDDAR